MIGPNQYISGIPAPIPSIQPVPTMVPVQPIVSIQALSMDPTLPFQPMQPISQIPLQPVQPIQPFQTIPSMSIQPMVPMIPSQPRSTWVNPSFPSTVQTTYPSQIYPINTAPLPPPIWGPGGESTVTGLSTMPPRYIAGLHQEPMDRGEEEVQEEWDNYNRRKAKERKRDRSTKNTPEKRTVRVDDRGASEEGMKDGQGGSTLTVTIKREMNEGSVDHEGSRQEHHVRRQ
ncbi:hypothetical protein M231_04609 [Tremella mesenterica]|uniref:Uncharacterized protein n=1 Tax=Tremella mesenterica TaxID=5217 RepID=A0A4Q1BK62_TREME|nr:hypothetical protein M231_04609 [Tremella mesenterica]